MTDEELHSGRSHDHRRGAGRRRHLGRWRGDWRLVRRRQQDGRRRREPARVGSATTPTVTIATEGVFELPKLASSVIAVGAKVSWDDTAKQVNAPGTGRYPIGTAIEAAGNGATTLRVRLDGIATAAA